LGFNKGKAQCKENSQSRPAHPSDTGMWHDLSSSQRSPLFEILIERIGIVAFGFRLPARHPPLNWRLRPQ
jgi:hypothetical protein